MLAERLTTTHPDVLRELLATFIHTLMGAEADALCGAGYGQRSAERTNQRNGYRHRQFDTRTGIIGSGDPQAAPRHLFPGLAAGTPQACRAGADHGGGHLLSARGVDAAMDKLVETLGITPACRVTGVRVMAKELDTAVAAFRTRPLDAESTYTFVAADALVLKVREQGRVVNVHALIATGVNAEGYREILGIDVTTAEDGAGWLTFLRSLTARGLSGVKLVTSDAHAGLVAAIGATLPGATWATLQNPLHHQPDGDHPESVVAVGAYPVALGVRSARRSNPLAPNTIGSSMRFRISCPRSPNTWKPPETTCWHSPRSPNRSGAKSGRTTPRKDLTRRSAGAPTSSASSLTATR